MGEILQIQVGLCGNRIGSNVCDFFLEKCTCVKNQTILITLCSFGKLFLMNMGSMKKVNLLVIPPIHSWTE